MVIAAGVRGIPRYSPVFITGGNPVTSEKVMMKKAVKKVVTAAGFMWDSTGVFGRALVKLRKKRKIILTESALDGMSEITRIRSDSWCLLGQVSVVRPGVTA